MKTIKAILLIGILHAISCSIPEESISFDPSLELTFSNDTVTFDTLLSDIQSPIQRLTVFNPNSEAIQLSSISLARGVDSDYSVIINGKPQNTVNQETIFGGDSIQILVDIDVNPRNQDDPYLVKDSIVFNWNGNSEHVKLVSWAQDANPVSQQVLCDEIWTSDRPYIISDTVVVDADCSLTIEAGTSVYFQNDAIMFILGSLVAAGDSSNNIVFTNSRFDSGFDEVPGQWLGIYFLEGSTGNTISYAKISNAEIGLRVGTPDDDNDPDVQIANTEIFNMSVGGILGFTSDIQVTNSLIYNCATYLAGGFAGGNYQFQHCTFSNESSFFIQDEPSVQFSDNIIISETELLVDQLSLTFENSIIWGSNNEELLINNGGGTDPIVVLSSNIIRSPTEIEGNVTSQDFNYPGFKSPFDFDYSLDTLANAQNAGTPIGILDDITGKLRDDEPDIGAYERFDK